MTTTTTHPGLLSLNDVAVAAGVTLDYLRKRLASNPHLQRLAPRVGRVFVVPSANLPLIRELLSAKPGARTGGAKILSRATV